MISEEDRKRGVQLFVKFNFHSKFYNVFSEMMSMHAYPSGAVMGGHPQLFLQPNMLAGRPATLYKLPPAGHTLMPPVNQYDMLAQGPPRVSHLGIE
jgi:hypothetical protein